MSETKIIIGVASLCSIAAILATLIVVPQLYQQINEVNSRVFDGVQAFRVNTDSAWTELMDVQISVTPPARPRENPFNSIFLRQKRGNGGLPPHPADPDNPEALASPDNSPRLALKLPPAALRAPAVRLDNLEAKDRPDPLEAMDNQDSRDKAEDRDRLALPDLLAREETRDSPEDLASPDSLEPQERKAPQCPARPDLPDSLVDPDNPADPDSLDSPEAKDLPDLLDSPEDPDSLEALDSPEPRAKLVSLATTVLTVLARLAPAFSRAEAASKCK
ncbi:hypothetical protein niasHS_003318 [Heterodera schachtii]|uniref:Nematode cuticle collagen N-terminal domain-containing protein n=1 Tax=Heterodera schachtii TaxID=97005 RepID=A0ABD2KG67_HETSC